MIEPTHPGVFERPHRWSLTAVLCLVALAGCEDDSTTKTPTAPIVAAWQAAGLTAPEFVPMSGAGIAGGECWSAQMEQLDTVLCRYADTDAAKSARSAGHTYIGETTGTALSAGVWLLVVADRTNAHPDGKKLNQVAKSFLQAQGTKSSEPAEGEKPDGEKAEGEKPEGEKPDGEKPDGEKPDGEKPEGKAN